MANAIVTLSGRQSVVVTGAAAIAAGLDQVEATAALAAASADDAADSAVIAQSLVGTIYASVAAGVAAVADGATFTVASGSASYLAAVYRRVGAAGVLLYKIPTIGSVPSLGQWQRLASKLDNATENAHIALAGDSTGDASTEWFYVLAVAIGQLYPEWTIQYRLWNNGSLSFDAASTIQTGTGSRVLTFWNGSIAGSTAHRFSGSDFASVFTQTTPDLIFLSYGHNGGTDATRQLSYWNGLAYHLRTDEPNVPVIMIGQNPTTTDETQAEKQRVLRPMASRFGWGFISVHDAFRQAGVSLASLMADTVHPNATGSALWRDTVLASYQASRAAYGGGDISPTYLIRAGTHPTDFNSWTLFNCTSAVQTGAGRFETEGRATTFTQTSTASGAWAFVDIVNSNDIKALIGKWVTFCVWQRVPAGSTATVGRIDIMDVGPGTTTTTSGVQQSNSDFILFTCTHKVSLTATALRVYIYVGASGAASAELIDVDRFSLVLGMTPIDPLPVGPQTLRSLNIYGAGASGIGALFNSSTTARGLSFVATETAAVATAYTTDLSSDGLSIKQAADVHPRVQITQAGAYFGVGTATPALRLYYRLSDGLGINCNFYPDSDATRDLGANGVAWRRVVVSEGYRVGANQVVGARGDGVADATGGATVDTEARAAINALLARLRTHGLIAT